MKKAIVISLVLALTAGLCLVGCDTQETSTLETEIVTASANETVEEVAGETVGGWLELTEIENVTVPEDVVALLEKAAANHVGMTFRPVALLGTQVVSGTNYKILCVGETVTQYPETKFVVVTIYEDLEGNVSITDIVDFNLLSYVGNNLTLDQKNLAGGWEFCESIPNIALDKDAQAAFDGATKDITDATYNPIALLGTQVVSGTNYAFLCVKTGTGDNPDVNLCVMTVYAKPDNTYELLGVVDLDLASFATNAVDDETVAEASAEGVGAVNATVTAESEASEETVSEAAEGALEETTEESVAEETTAELAAEDTTEAVTE